jgi:superfamily II DNA or RNA helicase
VLLYGRSVSISSAHPFSGAPSLSVEGLRADARRGSPAARAAGLAFKPRLRLFTEKMGLVVEGSRLGYRETEVPVASLRFDYAGVEVRATEGSADSWGSESSPSLEVSRHYAAEAECMRWLESFGAVEIECLDDWIAPIGSQADYVITVSGNVHALCSFTAQAIGQLRTNGWEVEIAADYPYDVVDPEAPWYASVKPAPEATGETDWFSLELGVEIDGHRINLLPPLLDMLDACGDTLSFDSLLKVPARYRAVQVQEKRYVVIPHERLQRLLTVLMEMYRGDRCPDDTLLVRACLSGALDRLDQALGSAVVQLLVPGALSQRRRAISQRPPEAPKAVSLRAELRPYQEEGVAWLQHLREQGVGGVLADDMGLGKTLQTITHLLLEKEARRGEGPTLVVAPTSLMHNWKSEIARFAPALRCHLWHGKARHRQRDTALRSDVLLTTYALLIRDLGWFKEQAFHYLILDEAQAIKNAHSLSAKAAGQIPAQHRLCLTGTPVENSLDELYSLFDFLMPGVLGTKQRFRTYFRDPIEKDGHEGRLLALRQALAPFILRRMKEEVARELPPKTELTLPVELGQEQRELYEDVRIAAHGEVRKAIRKKGVSASTVTILDGLMKLRQICCDPRLVDVPSARSTLASAKYNAFFDLLEQQLREGRRVLVFSQFTRMLALLALGLRERGLTYGLLTGATQDRQRQVQAFQEGEVDTFLISLKAGGTGLNLTRADTVIHYDPWWNAAAQAQATDRAYRIGQTRPVFVHNLIVAGSVEERMLHLQERKRHLAQSILGSGGEQGSPLSEEDIEDLFAPLAEP